MSADEIAAAKKEIRRLTLPLDLRKTRRLRPDPLGPVTDLRRTIRQSLRQGGEILSIARNRRQTRRRHWWCCATFPARCRVTRRYCCISCMR